MMLILGGSLFTVLFKVIDVVFVYIPTYTYELYLEIVSYSRGSRHIQITSFLPSNVLPYADSESTYTLQTIT